MSSDFLLRHLATVNADLENKEKGTSGKQARSDSKGAGKRKTSDGSSAEKRYFSSHIHMLSSYPLFVLFSYRSLLCHRCICRPGGMRGSTNYLDSARSALKRQKELKNKHKKLLAIASSNRKVKRRKKGEGYI